MIDVSATGAKVVISNGIGTLVHSDFADDQAPIDTEPVEATRYGTSLNGDLIVWSSPQVMVVRLSVVPNSDADVKLTTMLYRSKVKPSDTRPIGANANIDSLSIYIPNGNRTYTFRTGRLVSGPLAPSATNEGRLQGRQFTFVFEQL